MSSSLLAILIVLGVATPGGDPYFLLRPRLEAADAVLVGTVRSITDVEQVLRPRQRVAVLELSEILKGGRAGNAPETLVVRQWTGPDAEPDRRSPWVFFLSRSGSKQGHVYSFQVAVDLASLSTRRRDAFRKRILDFVEIERLRKPLIRQRAKVGWLMDQVLDPVSREGATFDLERPGFHSQLTDQQVTLLQDLYCSLDSFDMTAGHLTDVLDAVAVDRERFVRCAFRLLQGEVDRATWIEEGLVHVIESGLTCDEVAVLAQEYRATQPVVRMRSYEDSPERRASRRDVLRRLCEVAQRELDGLPEPATEVALPEAAAEDVQGVAIVGATGK